MDACRVTTVEQIHLALKDVHAALAENAAQGPALMSPTLRSVLLLSQSILLSALVEAKKR